MEASHATPNSPLVGRRRGRKTNEKPQRVVTVRMHRDLHKLLLRAAHAEMESMNVTCLRAIVSAISETTADHPDRFDAQDRQRLLELAEAVAEESG